MGPHGPPVAVGPGKKFRLSHPLSGPGPSVRNAFVKIDEKWIYTDLDSAGRGKKRDEEEGGGRRDKEEEGTRRKEGRGGRRDEESEKMKKLLNQGRTHGISRS